MRKIILLFTLALVTQISTAQRTAYHTQPEKLFNQGKEMFLEGNYVGAKDMLSRYTMVSMMLI